MLKLKQYAFLKLTLFIPVCSQAAVINTDEFVNKLGNIQQFNLLVNSVNNLTTLARRFPSFTEELFQRINNQEFFNAHVNGANDVYSLVETFPQHREEIFNLSKAKENGFLYYLRNSLDIFSESPAELILLAFPNHREEILEDFNYSLRTPVKQKT